jgi:PPK2 family polyphosphate:nucleotide phosphotransferase
MVRSPYRVEPGSKFHLADWNPGDTGSFKSKEQAKPHVKKNIQRMIELQDLLYASQKYAILIVLQAMDAGGKDGAINHVFSGVNPQGCDVTAFKEPSHLELAHDYLWRYHMACPRRGMIGIFNRSHYESVLVERVKKLVPKEIWSRRYDELNAFEKMLTAENTIILKFYLHISREEQKKRLEARLEDKNKQWKISPADLQTRKKWDDYMEAFHDAIRNCSTSEAPWYVVPSNHKWFRNWVISDTIVRTMEKLEMKYPPPPEGIDKLKVK